MFQTLLVKLASLLDRASIPYMVIGGQAVLYHGEPRLTRDIDITLGNDIDKLEDVLRSLDGSGLDVAASDIERFTFETHVLPLVEKASGIRVDLIFSFSEYEREALRRAISVPLGERMVRFVSVEDLIIHKLVAGRPRDLEDVRGILARSPRTDDAYLEKWLRSLGKTLDRDLAGEYRGIKPQALTPPPRDRTL
ncbi:MAG TPA: nucleotidyl transferase AbiEii/AbiGii toxin family protein [Bacteroidota bacterium]|nr:nucleotidyl transferase AbiEii/AbiGii toxin family protein [Bacteroidota bacterium]